MTHVWFGGAVVIPLLLLALAAPVATSTASAWQAAAARWEALAETEALHHDVTRVELAAARAEQAALRARVDTVKAEGAAEVAGLDVAVHEARARAQARVSPVARTWAAVGAGLVGAGLVALVGGGVLCRSAICREVALVGGGAAAVAGGTAVVIAW